MGKLKREEIKNQRAEVNNILKVEDARTEILEYIKCIQCGFNSKTLYTNLQILYILIYNE